MEKSQTFVTLPAVGQALCSRPTTYRGVAAPLAAPVQLLLGQQIMAQTIHLNLYIFTFYLNAEYLSYQVNSTPSQTAEWERATFQGQKHPATEGNSTADTL